VTHTLTFPDFYAALDAIGFLVQHGYRRLHGDLEPLVPKTTRIVNGQAFGRPRGEFVLAWMDESTVSSAGPDR
jgi:hypothetical protein